MLTYVSRFWSGGFEPFWPHILLLSVTVAASIAVGAGILFERPKYSPSVHRVAFWLIVGGIVFEAICTIFLFVFDEGISSSQQMKIIDLESQIAPRSWTKAQFDAFQELRGKVTDVGVFPEKDCLECRFFAGDIELALNAAGVQLYGDDNLEWMRGTGVFVWLPQGSNLTEHPLVVALQKAGLYGGSGFHNPSGSSPVRTDIPVIFVGEKFPRFKDFPYSPPASASWTIKPLRNPDFAPPDPATNRPTNKSHIQVGPQQ